ncbi:MAG TPA: hypothetical protein VF765_09075 [Polyangiaceae bacterium]
MGRESQVPIKNGEAPDTAVDAIDAGWEDDESEDEAADADDADLDAGWDEVDAAKSPEEREREWRGLTPEEREARAARAAQRKEKLRAKAAAKAERRKARASVARGKQKQKVQRPRREQPILVARSRQAEAPVVDEAQTSEVSGRRTRERRNDPRVLAFLVAIVLLAGGVALFLWKR